MVRELRDIVQIPSRPTGIPSRDDWRFFHGEFGKLPADFVDFANTYGTGFINGQLAVYTPIPRGRPLSLWGNIDSESSGRLVSRRRPLRGLKDESDVNKLLTFARGENGERLAWVMSGNPDSWRTVIFEPYSPFFENYENDFSRLIVGLVTHSIKSLIVAPDFCKDYSELIPVNYTPAVPFSQFLEGK